MRTGNENLCFVKNTGALVLASTSEKTMLLLSGLSSFIKEVVLEVCVVVCIIKLKNENKMTNFTWLVFPFRSFPARWYLLLCQQVYPNASWQALC